MSKWMLLNEQDPAKSIVPTSQNTVELTYPSSAIYFLPADKKTYDPSYHVGLVSSKVFAMDIKGMGAMIWTEKIKPFIVPGQIIQNKLINLNVFGPNNPILKAVEVADKFLPKSSFIDMFKSAETKQLDADRQTLKKAADILKNRVTIEREITSWNGSKESHVDADYVPSDAKYYIKVRNPNDESHAFLLSAKGFLLDFFVDDAKIKDIDKQLNDAALSAAEKAALQAQKDACIANAEIKHKELPEQRIALDNLITLKTYKKSWSEGITDIDKKSVSVVIDAAGAAVVDPAVVAEVKRIGNNMMGPPDILSSNCQISLSDGSTYIFISEKMHNQLIESLKIASEKQEPAADNPALAKWLQGSALTPTSLNDWKSLFEAPSQTPRDFQYAVTVTPPAQGASATSTVQSATIIQHTYEFKGHDQKHLQIKIHVMQYPDGLPANELNKAKLKIKDFVEITHGNEILKIACKPFATPATITPPNFKGASSKGALQFSHVHNMLTVLQNIVGMSNDVWKERFDTFKHIFECAAQVYSKNVITNDEDMFVNKYIPSLKDRVLTHEKFFADKNICRLKPDVKVPGQPSTEALTEKIRALKSVMEAKPTTRSSSKSGPPTMTPDEKTRLDLDAQFKDATTEQANKNWWGKLKHYRLVKSDFDIALPVISETTFVSNKPVADIKNEWLQTKTLFASNLQHLKKQTMPLLQVLDDAPFDHIGSFDVAGEYHTQVNGKPMWKVNSSAAAPAAAFAGATSSAAAPSAASSADSSAAPESAAPESLEVQLLSKTEWTLPDQQFVANLLRADQHIEVLINLLGYLQMEVWKVDEDVYTLLCTAARDNFAARIETALKVFTSHMKKLMFLHLFWKARGGCYGNSQFINPALIFIQQLFEKKVPIDAKTVAICDEINTFLNEMLKDANLVNPSTYFGQCTPRHIQFLKQLDDPTAWMGIKNKKIISELNPFSGNVDTVYQRTLNKDALQSMKTELKKRLKSEYDGKIKMFTAADENAAQKKAKLDKRIADLQAESAELGRSAGTRQSIKKKSHKNSRRVRSRHDRHRASSRRTMERRLKKSQREVRRLSKQVQKLARRVSRRSRRQ